jgi:hypothetical protein
MSYEEEDTYLARGEGGGKIVQVAVDKGGGYMHVI